ncbi:hypothetical protein FQR65_LT04340 [Abscondita terminalis]|nr:hypothetical protein FQR65_LT04340 [Abscondita terminalis]
MITRLSLIVHTYASPVTSPPLQRFSTYSENRKESLGPDMDSQQRSHAKSQYYNTINENDYKNYVMSRRSRQLVSLATKENKEVSDRLLNLPCYETTKPSSISDITGYLDVLKHSEWATQVASEGLNLRNVTSKSVFHETSMNVDVARKSVPQPTLNKEDSAQANTLQELGRNEGIAVFETLQDVTIDPPPLIYFDENMIKNINNSDCIIEKDTKSKISEEIGLQPNIVIHQNELCKTVERNAMNESSTNCDYLSEDDEIQDLYSTSDSDEYIPSDVVSDTSSYSSEVDDKTSWCDSLLKRAVKSSTNSKKPKKSKLSNKLRKAENRETESCLSNSSDEDTVKVTCSMKKDGKRIRNKRYCCYLCQKIVLNLSRHLNTVHSNDTAVARILALPKGSKQRREEFGKLMREGSFYHNCEVLQLKQGELILLRRPTPFEQKKYTYINYGPCPDCLGFMLKKNIAYHMKSNCSAKSKIGLKTRKPISESNAMLAGMFGPNLTSDFTYNILTRMRDDEITEICRQDQLILKFGFMMYEKYSTTQCELIRQSMRQIGRFFKEVHKVQSDIKCLSDCLKPQHFDVAVQATKILCVTTTNLAKRVEFQTPSLALKIGHALKKCISFERGNALRAGNTKRNRELESFLSLMDMEWSIRISSNALNTLHTRKFNCTQLLPVTGDLIKLNNYLECEIKKYKAEIEKTYQPSPSCWSRFAALILSKIVVFNKRRSGETSRITLEQYSMRPLWSEQTTEESKSAMTDFEKQLAEHFAVVEVLGKRGRRVPILLSPDMKSGIDLLLKTRSLAGISKDNPYVFARSGTSLEYLRGHDCLRKCCERAQLESPENINGTKLRKYIATVTQIINLTENETDWLARHLGHDVRVHRDFYRLHESAVELTKVSRLLLAVDSGQTHKFSGKKLDDIQLSDLPDIDLEDREPDENLDREVTSNDIPISEREFTLDNTRNNEEQNMPENTKKKSVKSSCVKKVWSEKEIEAVLKFFSHFIKKGTVPGKEKCEECMEKYPVFAQLPLLSFKMEIADGLTKEGKDVMAKKRGRPSQSEAKQSTQRKKMRGPASLLPV